MGSTDQNKQWVLRQEDHLAAVYKSAGAVPITQIFLFQFFSPSTISSQNSPQPRAMESLNLEGRARPILPKAAKRVPPRRASAKAKADPKAKASAKGKAKAKARA